MTGVGSPVLADGSVGIVTERAVFLPETNTFEAPTPFWAKLEPLDFGGLFADVPFAAGNEVGVFFVCTFVLTGSGAVGVRVIAMLAVGVAVVAGAVVAASEAVTNGAMRLEF